MILPQRIKNRTTTREKLSRLLKSVWARRIRGIFAKNMNPMAVVKKRQRNTGT
jgi:hypothetical protein